MTKFVDVETPYMADKEEITRRNILYARACVRDCLMRGEIPFASHLFYTQPGVLDDNVSEERVKGINAGKELVESLLGIVTAVYQDLGISKGMQEGIERAEANGRTVDYRFLGEDWEKSALSLSRGHSHAAIWGFNHF